MHSMDIEQEIGKLLIYHPDKIKEILLELHKRDTKFTERAVRHAVMGYHLDEEMMLEALGTIIKYDGKRAPFWSMTEFKDILEKNNISLHNEKYNEYDLNYLTQYYYADFKSLGSDPVVFIHLAEDRLHDIDDPKACEKAYWSAHHRICHSK